MLCPWDASDYWWTWVHCSESGSSSGGWKREMGEGKKGEGGSERGRER